MAYLLPYTAALFLDRRYQHHRSFATIDGAQAWANDAARDYPLMSVRVDVAKPREGGAVPVCRLRPSH